MPLFGKRNLVMLLVIKIFVIGLFLSGCQEGTNKSPVSALFTSDDLYGKDGTPDQVYNNSSIIGRIDNETTKTGQNGLYVFLYEWAQVSKPAGNPTETDYEVGDLIATYTTTADGSESGGNFEFKGLRDGKYCLYFSSSEDVPVPTIEVRTDSAFSWEVFNSGVLNYIQFIRNITLNSNQTLTVFTAYTPK